jgi:hypothetical protein
MTQFTHCIGIVYEKLQYREEEFGFGEEDREVDYEKKMIEMMQGGNQSVHYLETDKMIWTELMQLKHVQTLCAP